MALKAANLLGMQPAAGEEPARPPIDIAQPSSYATATFAFG